MTSSATTLEAPAALLIDSHCHLDRSAFEGGPRPVMDRARQAGVGAFIVIGVGSGEPARAAPGYGAEGREAVPELGAAAFAMQLAREIPEVRAVIGVHPHDATTLTDEVATELQALAGAPEVVAVGEMGLDFHYDYSPRATQREAFARQIAIARALGKPIVVHTREAAAETLALLRSEGARDVGGVIHCFSEDRAFAAEALDLGFDLSFSGIVTFKTATAVHDVAAWAPLDRILVETDSPYLAPVPLRGKTCEPAFLVHTARRLSVLRKMPFDEVVAATAENTRRRFRLD